MPYRTPTQATPLTPSQSARLRTLDIRLLATSTAIYLVYAALTVAPWPPRIIFLIATAAYIPSSIQLIRFRAELGLKRLQPLIPEYPRNLLHTGALMSCAMIAGVCGFVLATGETWPFMLVLAAFAGVGLTLANAAGISFTAGQASCPECQYPLDGLTFPRPCPECGLCIESEAATSHQLSKPKLRAAGIVIFVLPFLGSAILTANPGLLANRLPHPARLALAPTNTPAFNALNLAGLTPEQTNRLTDRILDARLTANEFAIEDQLAWLGQRFVNGHLTPEQAERFATEGYRVAIHADPIRRVGATMAVTLAGQPPAHNYTNPTFYYFTRGFSINNAPPTGADPHKRYLAMSLHRSLPKDSLSDPLTTLTPDTPGPLHIRIDLITITTPHGATPTITWHDDGSYTITPQPLTTHEHTIETTIHIAP